MYHLAVMSGIVDLDDDVDVDAALARDTPFSRWRPYNHCPSMSTSMDQDPRHRRRTTGCLTCRRRRVKCDEVRPRCRQCIRMERVCSWQGDHSNIVRAQEVQGDGLDQEAGGSFSIDIQAGSSNILAAEVEDHHHLPKRHGPVRAGESPRHISRLTCQ